MASTRKIQDTVNWASLFVGLIPLAGAQGIPNEPALTIANSVLGFLLGPPFSWRWNRKKVTVQLTAGQQPSAQSIPDFGWAECATVSDGTKTYPLEIRLDVDDTSDTGRPTHIAAELDDDNGNITISTYPLPDKTYTVTLTYQMKAVTLTSLTQTWSPIPDEVQYLYNSGFLAWVFEMADDGRFPIEYQKHIKSVIAASEGLNDTQKAIFLEEKLLEFREQQDAALGAQQSRGSRGIQ